MDWQVRAYQACKRQLRHTGVGMRSTEFRASGVGRSSGRYSLSLSLFVSSVYGTTVDLENILSRLRNSLSYWLQP